MNHAKVASIVIPVYNRAHTIMRCLDSIGSQDGIDKFDLIVVDNSSSDDSLKIIRQWTETHDGLNVCVLNQPKPGACAARNRGLEAVTTPYVMFFDSDDEMLPGHLDRILNAISAHPEIDVFGWDISCQLSDGRLYRAPFVSENALYNHLRLATFATQRFIAKTELVNSVGGWDENLSGWNDYELGVRLLLKSPSVMKLDDNGSPLVMTYFSEDSITGRQFSPTPEKWEKSLDRIEELLRTGRTDLLKAVAFRRAILSGIYAREGSHTDARRLLAKATAPGFGDAKAMFCHTFIRTLGRGAGFISKFVL